MGIATWYKPKAKTKSHIQVFLWPISQISKSKSNQIPQLVLLSIQKLNVYIKHLMGSFRLAGGSRFHEGLGFGN
jgi:hypothetical protein